jgi:hypothetical protein
MVTTERRWLLRRIFVAATSITIAGSIIYISWPHGADDNTNTLATGLSALALLGVVVALYFQAQQTEISRLEAARNHRASLIQFAINNPRLLAAWGFDIENTPKAQIEAYSSMVFSFFWMAYDLKELTEAELRWTCDRIFRDAEIAQWWQTVGPVYHEREKTVGRRRFARIVDETHAGRLHSHEWLTNSSSPARPSQS